MTDAERALLRQDELEKLERADAATPGPWAQDCTPPGPCGAKCYMESIVSVHDYPNVEVARRSSEASAKQSFKDVVFIAHARTDVPELLSRLAAARAGERELLEKASEIKSIRDKFHAKHFLDEGDTELMDSLICEIALMAELFPVAESETK